MCRGFTEQQQTRREEGASPSALPWGTFPVQPVARIQLESAAGLPCRSARYSFCSFGPQPLCCLYGRSADLVLKALEARGSWPGCGLLGLGPGLCSDMGWVPLDASQCGYKIHLTIVCNSPLKTDTFPRHCLEKGHKASQCTICPQMHEGVQGTEARGALWWEHLHPGLANLVASPLGAA